VTSGRKEFLGEETYLSDRGFRAIKEVWFGHQTKPAQPKVRFLSNTVRPAWWFLKNQGAKEIGVGNDITEHPPSSPHWRDQESRSPNFPFATMA
jgi:hypothetical protein